MNSHWHHPYKMTLPCLILAVLVLAALIMAPAVHAQSNAEKPTATKVLNTAKKTIAVSQQSQNEIDQWQQEAEQMQAQIDALQNQLKTLSWQLEKSAIYRADLEQKIAQLESDRQQAQRIGEQLEPFLDAQFDRLTDFVQTDLPFMTQMRQAQLTQLRRMLDDADASLTDKTRLFFEALTRETEYGHLSQSDEAELDIDGRTVRVQLFHVGRLALFALSLDSASAWRWNAADARFEPMNQYASQIRQAMEMANHSRLIALTRLPIGRPGTGAGDTN